MTLGRTFFYTSTIEAMRLDDPIPVYLAIETLLLSTITPLDNGIRLSPRYETFLILGNCIGLFSLL
jgi:hypothetical protein